MEVVIDRLRLDKRYYSKTENGFFTETVHRLKVAGKQILKRPWLLLDAIKKCSLKALWLPDTRRILIDKDLPPRATKSFIA
jgi:hypothetical protein